MSREEIQRMNRLHVSVESMVAKPRYASAVPRFVLGERGFDFRGTEFLPGEPQALRQSGIQFLALSECGEAWTGRFQFSSSTDRHKFSNSECSQLLTCPKLRLK